MIMLFLKLVLAHILGDFVFQPDTWVKDKRKRRHKSPKLYWHLGVHTLTLLLVLQFNLHYWLGILLMVVTHFAIDLGKLNAPKKMDGKGLFFIDQVLHLLVIAGVVYYYTPYSISIDSLYSPPNILLLVFLLLVTFVTSVTMKVLVSRWKPEEKPKEALKNAGAYIGMLERLFIFGFIVINYWEGIGFLLAAKSVFRFGDLSKSTDRNLTEYILIGTLLSFGIAILLAMGYLYFRGVLGS